MNRLLALLILLCPVAVLAQQKKLPSKFNVQLEGNINAVAEGNTVYFRHPTGTAIPVKVDTNGHFNAHILINEPGFYQLDHVGEIYLTPGYQLRVEMGKDSTYLFTGKGSQANAIYNHLKKAVSKFLPYQDHTGFEKEAFQMDPPVFLEKLAEFESYSKKILAEVPDPFFREMAVKDLQYYENRLLWSYTRGYEMNKGAVVKRMDSTLRKQIEKRVFYDIDPNQVKLYQNSDSYRTAVDEKFLYLMYTKIDPIDMRNKEAKILLQRKIANEMVKEPFILNQLNVAFTLALLKLELSTARRDSIYQAFSKGNPTKAQKAEVEQTYYRQLAYGDNGIAPDFAYADVNGKQIKLSDLRGKYVYIDIWATWCGPCKAQIPFLAKLESDYHGKTIQFLSISIDELKDKAQWSAFVQQQQLGGIQVMADHAFKSDFIQKFNINAIPRFILIDPQGKIVSANAKRPSDPELRKQLDKLL